MDWLPWYLLMANVVSFTMFGVDKARAARGGRRISESALITSAAVSGTIGGWLAMSAFRHKTRKRSFQARMVAATVLDAAILVGLLLLR